MPRQTQDSQRLIHHGVRFDVLEVACPRRSGGVERREVVVPADAVTIVPMLDADRVVLIRNERFAVNETLWELPAGTVEPGEDLAACAGRELVEETGYAAGRIERLCQFYTTPGFCTEHMTLFAAHELTFQGQDLDDTERITAEALPWDEVMAMLADNRIRDGKTIAGLLYFDRLKRGAG